MKLLPFIVFSLIISINSFATTWDEPWQKEILKKSDVFVFGEIIQTSDSAITLFVEKSFDQNERDTIFINGFFLLDLCSSSAGHGPEFHFNKGAKGYFFLKNSENNVYQLPTPTSGFALISEEDKVIATYRHSYHQALISPEVYESTYTEIWNYYRNKKIDIKDLKSFIDPYLNKDPAGFEDHEIDTFFNQHVALETAYLLDMKIEFEILKKFAESTNFHSQVSALRAMENTDKNLAKDYLLDYIKSENKGSFTKVIAIWSFWKIANKRMKKLLISSVESISDENTGFGGNIMDPRVCTYFPSPQRAVKDLTLKN